MCLRERELIKSVPGVEQHPSHYHSLYPVLARMHASWHVPLLNEGCSPGSTMHAMTFLSFIPRRPVEGRAFAGKEAEDDPVREQCQ